MQTTIPCEDFYFSKQYIFEDLIILNPLYEKYIANKTFDQFTK